MKKVLGVLLSGLLAATVLSQPTTSAGSAVAAETATRKAAPAWRLVVDDRFESGGVPGHWTRYDGPYGSGPENCARPDHAFVKNGKMRMVLRYRSSGDCGSGWYSAGMMLSERYQSVDQKVSVRFRVVQRGGVQAHRIIPMRWPSNGEWPAGGEEDYCESSSISGCSTFLHSASGREDTDYRVNLGRWHTMTFVRRNFTVRSIIDGETRWTFRGDRSSLPATLKRPVLQQECRSSCPSGRTGREVILIDRVRVWNPAR